LQRKKCALLRVASAAGRGVRTATATARVGCHMASVQSKRLAVQINHFPKPLFFQAVG
jgi:hypothetical protein